VSGDLTRALVLPARRGGRRWDVRERRSLNREELTRLLEEIPSDYQALFALLASTGLRISEAIGLRWCDLDLDTSPPSLRVRQAIVKTPRRRTVPAVRFAQASVDEYLVALAGFSQDRQVWFTG
jgi:integrase